MNVVSAVIEMIRVCMPIEVFLWVVCEMVVDFDYARNDQYNTHNDKILLSSLSFYQDSYSDHTEI